MVGTLDIDGTEHGRGKGWAGSAHRAGWVLEALQLSLRHPASNRLGPYFPTVRKKLEHPGLPVCHGKQGQRRGSAARQYFEPWWTLLYKRSRSPESVSPGTRRTLAKAVPLAVPESAR